MSIIKLSLSVLLTCISTALCAMDQVPAGSNPNNQPQYIAGSQQIPLGSKTINFGNGNRFIFNNPTPIGPKAPNQQKLSFAAFVAAQPKQQSNDGQNQ